ncbi:MAG: 30S ribosomal protein S4 [Candidatus Aenigmatarchaeota archaeon]
MGHPRKHRAKWSRPLKPFEKARIESERAVMRDFGLRRKHELWRAEGIVRDFHRRARELLAVENPKLQEELFARLRKLGFNVNTLDDVLALKTEDVLERRLQTRLVKRGIAKTAKQARQLIVHRHVLVDGQVVRWPSALVPVGLDDKIDVSPKIKAKLAAAANA